MSEEPETDKPESPRRSTSSGSDGTKSRGRKAKHTGQRNPNPGIDVALRNLRDEVVGAGKLYQNFVGEFDTQVSAIADWADNYTIDTVWRNKVKAKVRNQEEGERLGGVLERLSSRRKSIVDALANAESVTPAWKDKHKLELQIRTAKKALVYSDGLIELARKALEERVSSRQLIQELNEASSLLEQKRHPWIYGYGGNAGTEVGDADKVDKGKETAESSDDDPPKTEKPTDDAGSKSKSAMDHVALDEDDDDWSFGKDAKGRKGW